jgi:hypothetical protein
MEREIEEGGKRDGCEVKKGSTILIIEGSG